MNLTVAPRSHRWGRVAVAALAVWAGQPAAAVEPKQANDYLQSREFFRPDLYISSSHVPLADVVDQLPNKAAWQTFTQSRDAAGQDAVHVYLDPRSAAVVNLMAPFPLIPGNGVGNEVSLQSLGQQLGRQVNQVDERVVADATLRFVQAHATLLGIDTRQLGAVKAAQVTPELWQVSIPQQFKGVPVRDGRLAATISHGNLVVIGTETWGDVKADATPVISADKALDAGFAYAAGRSALDVIEAQPELQFAPFAPQEFQAGEGFVGPLGKGYGHVLVWRFVFNRPPYDNRWEVLVDAHKGEVLAFQDLNQHVTKQVTGGVYPLTNTGTCANAQICGTMQSNWPMPFANTGFAAPNNFTNSAGLYDYTSGTLTTTLAGKYVNISDNCGAVNATSATGDLNLGGTNNQHDCTTPGSGGAGNTPAARSAFYELNRIAEQARGWLPSNTWLQTQLTANVNINLTCNAFWGGGTVNFYRSGGGCGNTGEMAGVFDHEWGHGLDDNDAVGTLSNSSEAYADVAALYRLNTSCVGQGFFNGADKGCGLSPDGTPNQNEHQNGGSHCDLSCSGVRDADWDKHADHTPDTPLNFVCSACLTSSGPCGRQVHCAAAPSRQAAWDLVARDLRAAPFNMNAETALMVGNKIFYQGSGNIGLWHACTCGSSSDGCGATNAYTQWLAADDDNGNVNDGTPHMTALFAAFNRHGIACATPAATNSGCAGGPTTATSLTVTPGNNQNTLSWTAVSGASRYWVLRTEGHAGCDFGKTKIAEVTTTTYTDAGLLNGRQYSYNVVAQGATAACYGPTSACVQGTPTTSSTPDFALACSPASLTATAGGSASSTCTVTSTGGFASAVALDCASLPAGVTCGYAPASVTPPANGSVNSALTVSVAGSVAAGGYSFSARGTSGATVRTATINLTVNAAPTPDFSVACSPASFSTPSGGGSATSTCTVTSTNGFASAVALDCTGQPAGVTCGYAPASVTPPANGSISSTLTVTASAAVAAGTYNFSARGTSGALVRTAALSLTVNPPAGGNVVRTYVASPAAAIPDNNTTGVTSTITVPDSMTITSVSVNVGITHTYQGDLEVALIAPDNTTVLLHNRTGAGADNINTTYDITTRSAQALSVMTGKNISGAWKLRVRDLASVDTGTLNTWKLTFNGYYTAAPALAIPDNNTTGVTSTITVPATGTLASLRVRVAITHTYQGDLEVALIGPDNTTVLLHNRTGAGADNIQTVYPDLTASAQALTAFNGKAINGAWKLRVRDLATVDTGTLTSWELDFRTQ